MCCAGPLVPVLCLAAMLTSRPACCLACQTATLPPLQQQQEPALSARVFVASAAGLPPGAVADTTGAGDAFIGSVLYGLATGMPVERIMQLGAAVAACKCTALGARPGLPSRQQLLPELLA